MTTKTLPYLFTFIFVWIILITSSFAQGTFSIGVNASVEKNPNYDPNYKVGISIEKLFCQKNSVVVEVNYRRFMNNFSKEQIDFVFLKNFSIAESFLNISLLNKYHFKHFNIAFGPSVDMLLNWQNKSSLTYFYSNYLDRNAYYGLVTKISKTFAINDKISLDPEIHYNSIFSPITLYSRYIQLRDRQYLGLGIHARYKL